MNQTEKIEQLRSWGFKSLSAHQKTYIKKLHLGIDKVFFTLSIHRFSYCPDCDSLQMIVILTKVKYLKNQINQR